MTNRHVWRYGPRPTTIHVETFHALLCFPQGFLRAGGQRHCRSGCIDFPRPCQRHRNPARRWRRCSCRCGTGTVGGRTPGCRDWRRHWRRDGCRGQHPWPGAQRCRDRRSRGWRRRGRRWPVGRRTPWCCSGRWRRGCRRGSNRPGRRQPATPPTAGLPGFTPGGAPLPGCIRAGLPACLPTPTSARLWSRMGPP